MKAIIFDLDNCLSASDEMGKDLFAPVFAAVRAANDGSVPEARLEEAFSDMWRHALDWVADRYGFTPAMRDAGWREFAKLEITQPMHGYPDLHLLAALPAARFLVTSGFRRLQESKIRALGIEAMFTAIHVDAIDEPDRKEKGKREVFEAIMATHRLAAADVLVVGDNPESEIKAGNSLGLETVQTLRPGISRGTTADHCIHSLSELFPLVTEEK